MTTACASQQKEPAASGVDPLQAAHAADIRAVVLSAIAHIFRMLATPGAIRSINHLLALCLDIDAHIIRYLFAEARRADPSLPDLDPRDFRLVWNDDGDFDIRHVSEIARASRAQVFHVMRRFVLLQRLLHLRGLQRRVSRASWAPHALRPDPVVAPAVRRAHARAPPLPA